jgi:multimeric flavodoxin WrbA
MRVCILNGNPGRENDALETWLAALERSLDSRGDAVRRLDLRELQVRYCTGCWGCWVKTPGECVARDDSALVCREVIHSDLTLFASPVLMGFPSALLKKVQDKLIPLIHPYIQLVHGECHHQARYERYPKMGLVLHAAEDTDEEDLRLVSGMYARTALNLKSRLVLERTTQDRAEEVADEIDSL